MLDKLRLSRGARFIILFIVAAILFFGGSTIFSAVRADHLASRLEKLYFQEDYERGASEGLAWTKDHPPTAKVMAWLVLLEARAGMAAPALAQANVMATTGSDLKWAAFAEAGALIFDNRREAEALAAGKRALAQQPNLEEAQWLYAESLRVRNRFGEAISFLDGLPNAHRSSLLLSVRGAVMLDQAKRRFYDKAIVAAALGVFRQAAEMDPTNVKALFLPGYALMDADRPADACPYLEKAARLSSSARVHGLLWDCLNEDSTRTLASRDQAVDADVSYSLDADHVTAQLLDTAAVMYETRGRNTAATALRDRLIKEFPASPYTGDELIKRVRVSLNVYQGTYAPDSLRKSAVESLRGVASQPNLRGTRTAKNANLLLLKLLTETSSASPADVLTAVNGVVASADEPSAFAKASRGLAQRGINLNYAQALAQRGLQMLPDYAAGIPFPNAALRDGWMRIAFADLRDALGYSMFRAGLHSAARQQLELAHSLDPTSRDTIFHLGELASQTGELTQAETWFIRCASMAGSERNPCAAALSSLYVRRTGSQKGLDVYLQSLRGRMAAVNKTDIAESRVERGKPLTFEATALDGKKYSSSSLRGRVVVVNFWGIWCDACRVDLPEFARFAARYRADPAVVFISVNDGRDLEGTRRWLQESGFALPVIVDLRLGIQADVHAIPTTIFLDHIGRTAFKIEGIPSNLDEQFAKRIDVLRAEREPK